MISIQLRNIILSLSLHATFPLVKPRMLLASTTARDQCSFSACCLLPQLPGHLQKSCFPTWQSSDHVIARHYSFPGVQLLCICCSKFHMGTHPPIPSAFLGHSEWQLCPQMYLLAYNSLSSACFLRMVSTHSSRLLTKQQGSQDRLLITVLIISIQIEYDIH